LQRSRGATDDNSPQLKLRAIFGCSCGAKKACQKLNGKIKSQCNANGKNHHWNNLSGYCYLLDAFLFWNVFVFRVVVQISYSHFLVWSNCYWSFFDSLPKVAYFKRHSKFNSAFSWCVNCKSSDFGYLHPARTPSVASACERFSLTIEMKAKIPEIEEEDQYNGWIDQLGGTWTNENFETMTISNNGTFSARWVSPVGTNIFKGTELFMGGASTLRVIRDTQSHILQDGDEKNIRILHVDAHNLIYELDGQTNSMSR